MTKVKIISKFAGPLLGVFFLILLFNNLDFENVITILKNAKPFQLLIGLLFLFLGLYLKTIRWRILLNNKPLKRDTFYILSIGYMVNNILPARAGEVAKVYLMSKISGIGFVKTLGTIFVEKVFDTSVLLIILVANLTHLYFSGVNLKILFGGLVLPEFIKERINQFFESFRSLKNNNNFYKIFILTFLIWMLEAFWNLSILSSLGIKVGILAAFFIAAFVNLSFSVPSLPGYFGIFHLMATLALTTWGVEKNEAFAYAFLQHSMEYIILTLLGAYSAYKLSFNPFENKKWQRS